MTSFLIVIAIAVLMIAALVLEHRRKGRRTVDEYEAEVRRGHGGAVRGALLEIDQCLRPSAQEMREALEEQGRLAEADSQGDDPDAIEAWRDRAR